MCVAGMHILLHAHYFCVCVYECVCVCPCVSICLFLWMHLPVSACKLCVHDFVYVWRYECIHFDKSLCSLLRGEKHQTADTVYLAVNTHF